MHTVQKPSRCEHMTVRDCIDKERAEEIKAKRFDRYRQVAKRLGKILRRQKFPSISKTAPQTQKERFDG